MFNLEFYIFTRRGINMNKNMQDRIRGDANVVSKQTKFLSDFVFETKFEDLSDGLLDRAKLIIADTVGVAFRGSLEPEMKNLYDRLSKGGKAVVIKKNLPQVNDISMAGFVNATAICSVELDALTSPATHAALHVLPPTLALAQSLGKSGADFLTAFILGSEVYHRIEKATKLQQGVYPFGNSGHIGGIVAIGKLFRWDAEQFR